MRNDQIFVLMLVVLLPMSGCFDGAVGDAEGTDESESTVINNYYNNTTVEQNSPPVLVGGIALTSSCPINPECGVNEMIWPTLSGFSMVQDYDGHVVSFGIDLDLDLTIDFEMPGNYSQYEMRMSFEMNESLLNPIQESYYSTSLSMVDVGRSYCYQIVNIIAIDDDDAATISPQVWIFDWDTESETCVIEP
jgi:hypothetical protein